MHITLLQIQTTALGQGLPSPATMLFNCPIRGIMPVINRPPFSTNNDDDHHKVLIDRQNRNDKGKDASRNFVSLSIESTASGPMRGQGTVDDGTTEGKGDHNHHNTSYKICITKTENIVTHNKQHIKSTPVLTSYTSTLRQIH